jgi:hypothetical protein
LLSSFFFSFYRYLYHAFLAYRNKKGALAHYLNQNTFSTGAGALLRAHLAALRMFPIMWQRRRQLRRIKRITDLDIRRLYDCYGISTREMASYE